jgi:hypothetical protein
VTTAVKTVPATGWFPIMAAGSNGRCNTIYCTDSMMLPRRNPSFGWARSKPSQG